MRVVEVVVGARVLVVAEMVVVVVVTMVVLMVRGGDGGDGDNGNGDGQGVGGGDGGSDGGSVDGHEGGGSDAVGSWGGDGDGDNESGHGHDIGGGSAGDNESGLVMGMLGVEAVVVRVVVRVLWPSSDDGIDSCSEGATGGDYGSKHHGDTKDGAEGKEYSFPLKFSTK